MNRPSASTLVVIASLALVQLGFGLFALRATLVHTATYAYVWQWRLEIFLFSVMVLNGLGLLRRKRWAAYVSIGLLYCAFLGVMIWLSLAFSSTGTSIWYWLATLILPLLGGAVHVLRREREYFS